MQKPRKIAERRRDWAALVPRAVAAYNDTVHSALIVRAADDVEDDSSSAARRANATFILKTLPDGTNSLRPRADVEAFLLESAEPAAPEARANGAN
jgi:hypothetical protein